MTIRHLRIFTEVCACKSVTGAAKKLYLAQPSVSLAIRELEEHYGVKLFDRIARRLDLTEAGTRLLTYATHIISLFDDMERDVQQFDGQRVRVATSLTIGTCLLPGLAKRFSQTHPEIELQAMIENSEWVIEGVLANNYDFAMVEAVPDDPQLLTEQLMPDELAAICAPGHPLLAQKDGVSAADFAAQKIIMREKGSGTRELFDSVMLVHNIKAKPFWESANTQAIIAAVSAGIGVSVLPEKLLEEALREGKVCRLTLRGVSFKRSFYLIRHQNKYLSPAAQDFMELCRGLRGENGETNETDYNSQHERDGY